MSIGVGGSQYAQEYAIRDWDNYYSLVKSNLNQTIIRETANSNSLSQQITAKQAEINKLT